MNEGLFPIPFGGDVLMACLDRRNLDVELAVPRTNSAILSDAVAVVVNPIEDDVARTDGHRRPL